MREIFARKTINCRERERLSILTRRCSEHDLLMSSLLPRYLLALAGVLSSFWTTCRKGHLVA
jgi:hypothetical protein